MNELSNGKDDPIGPGNCNLPKITSQILKNADSQTEIQRIKQALGLADRPNHFNDCTTFESD